MLSYPAAQALFCRGNIYGIDEQTHVHTDVKINTAVINCFNLSKVTAERAIRFAPAKLGMASGKTYQFSSESLIIALETRTSAK